MTLSSPARQTTVVSLSGPAAMVPTTALTTVMRKAVVSHCVLLILTNFHEKQLVPGCSISVESKISVL